MFTQDITLPAVYDSIKESAFPKIHVDNDVFDCSMGIVLRMLLKDRAEEDFYATIMRINSRDPLDYTASILDSHDLSVLFMATSFDKIDEILAQTSNKDKWTEKKDLQVFTDSFIRTARFFVNDETKHFAVFANQESIRMYHLLTLLIPRYAPHLFKDSPRTTPEETEFLKAFTVSNGSVNRINTYIAEYFAKPEYEETMIRSFVKTIRECMRDDIIRSQRMCVQTAQNSVNAAAKTYMDWCRKLSEENIRLNGLIAGTTAINEGELSDYLLSNRNVEIIGVDRGILKAVCKGYLTQVDADTYDEYIRNESSFLNERVYGSLECFADKENRKLLLDALFSQKAKYKVRVCGYYKLSANSVNTEEHFYFGPKYDNYIPNPHLDNFACLGNYLPLINDKMREFDIVGALDLCMASVSSMNICESVTVQRFLSTLFNTPKKCIITDEGKAVTPKEALELLKKEKEAE